MRNLGQAIDRKVPAAQRKARKIGEEVAIIDIDSLDGFRLEIWRYEDCFLDEFIAFDGRILAIVHPDGAIE